MSDVDFSLYPSLLRLNLPLDRHCPRRSEEACSLDISDVQLCAQLPSVHLAPCHLRLGSLYRKDIYLTHASGAWNVRLAWCCHLARAPCLCDNVVEKWMGKHVCAKRPSTCSGLAL